MTLALTAPPIELGMLEWGIVALTIAIIAVILGPRLLRDVRGWLRS